MKRLIVVAFVMMLVFPALSMAQEVYLDHVEYVGFWTILRVSGITQWALLVRVDNGIMPVLIKDQNNAWYWHDNLSSGDRISVIGQLKNIQYIENDGSKKWVWVVERGSVSNWIIKH